MNTTSLLTSAHPHFLDFVQLVLRVWIGGLLFAHGYTKMAKNGKIAGTAGWFASIGMKPGVLNAYAASLAQAFHAFYTQCRVITEDAALTSARLRLLEATRLVLARTLGLMGIGAPESM